MKCSSWEMRAECPLVAPQGVFQHIAAGNIEVIGRLIHHDEVVGDGQSLGQAEPRLLSAGKRPTSASRSASPLNRNEPSMCRSRPSLAPG